MKVRIARFEVRGFRSCKKTTFLPQRDLTSLVGLNGSGKSNVLQAILLLRRIATGGFSRDSRLGSTESQLRIDFDVGGKRIGYRAKVVLSAEAGVREEVHGARELWNFRSVNGKKAWVEIPLLHDPYPPFGRSIFLRHHGNRAIYFRRGGYFEGNFGRREVRYLQEVSRFCSGIVYYSASRFTNPSVCPSLFEIEANGRLRHSAGTHQHVDFLYDLYRCWTDERPLYTEYESLVGRGGIGLIDGITWKTITAPSREVRVRGAGKVVHVRRDRKVVIPTIAVRGVRLTPSQLSEGTFRSLALIFNLLSAKTDLLLIEEPEVCVHHGLLSSIMEVIKSCAARKQVIFSTHSDFVLDSVKPENVFLVRYSSGLGTTVKQLPDVLSARNFASLKEYLQTSGNLGEYWRHRGFN